jgi:hypothetical protein
MESSRTVRLVGRTHKRDRAGPGSYSDTDAEERCALEEKGTETAKKRYVPPEILATYSKKDLDEMIRRSGLHGRGGGCGCDSGSETYSSTSPRGDRLA